MSDHELKPNGTPAPAGVPTSLTEFESEPVAQTDAATPPEPTAEEILEQRDQQIQELQEQVKRVSAEFENFRRRQTEEQKRRLLLMKEDLFRSILPLVDNLDRTLDACRTQASIDTLVKGVELIRREFATVLENHEITPIPTQGEIFDPALHEAMMVEESAEHPDQAIVAELQRGYRMAERVLRPSMVKVARLPEGSQA